MKNKPDFITDLDYKLLCNKYTNIDDLNCVLEKIKNNYPVQYLIGDVEFLNNTILVDERVLIPRFETELLVSKLDKYIKDYSLENSIMIDLCTGSGCIAIALKSQFNESSVIAYDISSGALELASRNADINHVKVDFRKCDILNEKIVVSNVSVLVSNPPYVKSDEYVSPNTKFEPQNALFPGEDDIIFYKKILTDSKFYLSAKNIIAFEIGSTQADRIVEYAKNIYPNANIKVEKDYAGFDRYIFIFNFE